MTLAKETFILAIIE